MMYKIGDVIKGTLFGNSYEVRDLLGAGGFGVVYLVYFDSTNKFYALKTLHEECLKNAQSNKAFIREAQTWLRLDEHPNIVSAYDIETSSENLFIVLEYVPRNSTGLNSLQDYVMFQPPNLLQVLRWSIQFCYGIEYAYSKGISAHRDIKPANIMINREKIVEITDFGLAGVVGSVGKTIGIRLGIREGLIGLSCNTLEGACFGTPTHMPPEQFVNAKDCDEKSDLYSFGVVLYQMASGGKLPFLANLPRYDTEKEQVRFWKEMFFLHRKASVPIIKSPLFPLISKCLSKDPVKRFPSFAQLRDELEAILWKTGGGIVPRPDLSELTLSDLLIRADCFEKLGSTHDMFVYLERAVLLDPHCAFAWIKKGYALYKQGRYEESIPCYDQALKINPQDDQAMHYRAMAKDRISLIK